MAGAVRQCHAFSGLVSWEEFGTRQFRLYPSPGFRFNNIWTMMLFIQPDKLEPVATTPRACIGKQNNWQAWTRGERPERLEGEAWVILTLWYQIRKNANLGQYETHTKNAQYIHWRWRKDTQKGKPYVQIKIDNNFFCVDPPCPPERRIWPKIKKHWQEQKASDLKVSKVWWCLPPRTWLVRKREAGNTFFKVSTEKEWSA